ncbi:MAG: hypothetical protein ACO4CG_14325, partial [Prochlorothrix sp.]
MRQGSYGGKLRRELAAGESVWGGQQGKAAELQQEGNVRRQEKPARAKDSLLGGLGGLGYQGLG